jgi:hypothetical protein
VKLSVWADSAPEPQRAHAKRSLLAQALVANFLPVVVSALGVFVLAAIILLGQRGAFQREVEMRTDSLAKLLGQQLELPMLLEDTAEIERIARRVLKVDDVIYVAVDNARGAALLEIRQPEVSAEDIPAGRSVVEPISHFHGRTRRQKPFLETTVSVESGNGKHVSDLEPAVSRDLGRVRVGLSLEKQAIMFNRTLLVGGPASLIVLITILAVQHRKMRQVLAPLKSLIEVTRTVAKGDLTQRATWDSLRWPVTRWWLSLPVLATVWRML